MRHDDPEDGLTGIYVSIHASVKDATCTGYNTRSHGGFNPRICKRCDRCGNRKGVETGVSIHASVKDATKISLVNIILSLCFNPRICKRCDTKIASTINRYNSFNPRICKRCDRVYHDKRNVANCFNPRICKRCDSHTDKTHNIAKVSIHASVKDATPCL